MDDLRGIKEWLDQTLNVNTEVISRLLDQARPRLERALKRIGRPIARIGLIESSIGRLMVAESDRGLVRVRYIDGSEGDAAMIAALRLKFDLVEDAAMAARIGNAIERSLAGDTEPATHHPVDYSLVGSPFQRRALVRLRQVPAGGVITYQALAAAIGAPSGQRAIGNAMATNPLPIFLPCHRVIRSDGTIGNYGGGVERKLKLLRAEGFRIDQGNRVPPGAVYGHWQSHIFCQPACPAVRRANRKQWIIFTDPDRALGSGMRPCKLCHPAG